MSAPHRVVIVGGGFGGLYAAKSLGKAPVAVTLIDRRNFHLFQPLLYQEPRERFHPVKSHRRFAWCSVPGARHNSSTRPDSLRTIRLAATKGFNEI